MTDNLGHAKHGPVIHPSGKTRNGKSKKTLKGHFEPLLIPKYLTRLAGFDDKFVSLYARGMTIRENQSHLEKPYAAEVSPSLVSSVTDAVADGVKAWQSRPLEPIYPIVYLDCNHVKVRDTKVVRVKAVYLAIGINLQGEKEVIGLWIAQTEGAKFWLHVVTELISTGQKRTGAYRTFSSPVWMG